MVFRIEKNKNYTVMSNYHLRDKNISLKAKGLLSWMLSNTDDWDYSVKGIVANCKENETAVESALAELKEFGYIHVTKLMPNQTKSGRIEYVYDVFEQPKQGGEILPLEIQVVENHPQRSTIARSTKEEITIPKGIGENPSDNSQIELSEYEQHMYEDDVRKTRKISQPKEHKKSRWEKCCDEIDEFTDNEELRKALRNYLTLRLSIKDKPIYANQWKSLLGKLASLGGDMIAIVKQSTELGYASFYPLRTSYNRGGKPTLDTFSEHEEMSCEKVTQKQREERQLNGTVY